MFSDPTFWVAIAFILCMVGLGFLKVHKTIGGMLDARADAIRAELDAAQKLREDAQALLAQYQRKQREAMQEAEQMVAHARHEAKRIVEQGQTQLSQSIERRERMAMTKISQAESDAIAEVRATAVDVAMAATEQVLRTQLSADRQAKLVDDTIASLKTLH
ncbi:ATP synthase subunit b 1 [Tistrella bauzanensis]|uniref:ATP synthase subunit b n=1 Tax=Tistrella bauzanensis TaxID=657419 RepID=A0ABQ1I9G2_9PROT|nr:F0F1 ATP synthase subunit B [Tistrella bauzanensis]GGB29982.1 ATP synthase subunit b 1 [Tistrella bauzanensis]